MFDVCKKIGMHSVFFSVILRASMTDMFQHTIILSAKICVICGKFFKNELIPFIPAVGGFDVAQSKGFENLNHRHFSARSSTTGGLIQQPVERVLFFDSVKICVWVVVKSQKDFGIIIIYHL